MAISPINLALERLRQSGTLPKDDKYFKLLLHFFELRVPSEILADTTQTYLFPLVLNPQMYSIEEPFTVETTPTQGGGLFVEENGIIQRNIKISGTTGFRPRKLRGSPGALSVLKPENKSFTRNLDPYALVNISGQRHLFYLQDAVFRTYADLKKDPTTAKDTSLIYHNPKDDEHWIVVPQKFLINRDKSQPTLYNYEIDLLVVDKAEADNTDFSEEAGTLAEIKDAVNTVKRGLALAEGAVNDLNAIVGEISGFVDDIVGLVGTITTIIDAVSNFVDGVVDLIETPLKALDAVNEAVEALNALAYTIEEAGDRIESLPDKVFNKLRQVVGGFETIGQHPAKFETPLQKKLRLQKDNQELGRSTSTNRRREATQGLAPTSLRGFAQSGTELTPGDVRSADGTITSGRNIPNYKSAKEVSLTDTDTLVSLAAKYLGDARAWQTIAILNGIKPPFIDDQATQPLVGDDAVFPSSIGVGSKILIPSPQIPPEDRPQLPVLGVRNEEPVENHLLGTDLKLEIVGGRDGAPLFDIPVDSNRGSKDFVTTSGVENISQAIQTRLRTERGQDILYRNVGIKRVVGMNNVDIDLEMVRYRVQETLEQDNRISSVRKVDFENAGESDQLSIEVDIELRGFASSSNIKAVI